MRGRSGRGRSTTVATVATLVTVLAVAALVGCAPSAPPAGYASGCGRAAAPVYLQQRLLRSGGVVRTFLLTIPVGYDPNVPTPARPQLPRLGLERGRAVGVLAARRQGHAAGVHRRDARRDRPRVAGRGRGGGPRVRGGPGPLPRLDPVREPDGPVQRRAVPRWPDDERAGLPAGPRPPGHRRGDRPVPGLCERPDDAGDRVPGDAGSPRPVRARAVLGRVVGQARRPPDAAGRDPHRHRCGAADLHRVRAQACRSSSTRSRAAGTRGRAGSSTSRLRCSAPRRTPSTPAISSSTSSPRSRPVREAAAALGDVVGVAGVGEADELVAARQVEVDPRAPSPRRCSSSQRRHSRRESSVRWETSA